MLGQTASFDQRRATPEILPQKSVIALYFSCPTGLAASTAPVFYLKSPLRKPLPRKGPNEVGLDSREKAQKTQKKLPFVLFVLFAAILEFSNSF